MRPLLLTLLGVTLTSLIACGAGEEPHRGSTEDLQGGQPWGGDYAVGMIAMVGGAGVCTGTLIAPDVVLTAGHCVDRQEIDAFYLGKGQALFGTEADPPLEIPANMVRYEIDRGAVFPSFDISTVTSCPIETGDIALLKLKSKVSGIPPRRILEPGASPGVKVGQTCWAVGYGRHDEDGRTSVKQKRIAAVVVTEVSPISITVEAAPHAGGGLADSGDSGGPLLCFAAPGEVVAGVVSCHTDGTGAAHKREVYARVDAHADWLNGALESFPVELECPTTGLPMRCTGETLEYCSGRRWQAVMTCSGSKHCSAERQGCYADE